MTALFLGPAVAVDPARALGPDPVAAPCGSDVASTSFPTHVVGPRAGAPAGAVLDEPEVQGAHGEVTGSHS
jgi:hypothetical protein